MSELPYPYVVAANILEEIHQSALEICKDTEYTYDEAIAEVFKSFHRYYKEPDYEN